MSGAGDRPGKGGDLEDLRADRTSQVGLWLAADGERYVLAAGQLRGGGRERWPLRAGAEGKRKAGADFVWEAAAEPWCIHRQAVDERGQLPDLGRVGDRGRLGWLLTALVRAGVHGDRDRFGLGRDLIADGSGGQPGDQGIDPDRGVI